MSLGIGDAWRWRAEKIADLDTHVSRAQTAICERTRAGRVEKNDLGGTVWGQFLDDFHHPRGQWGHFGTSAAVQVLAIGHRMDNASGSVMDTFPLDRLAPVLPDQVPDDLEELPKLERRLKEMKADDSATDADIGHLERQVAPQREDPFKHQDFHDPLKTAFVVEALTPDQTRVEKIPALVEYLLSARWDEGEWNPSAQKDRDRSAQDRLLTTAYVLHALRRYPSALADGSLFEAHDKLARNFLIIHGRVGEDLWALTCLALTAMDDRAKQELAKTTLNAKVQEALKVGSEQLQQWVRTEQSGSPVITRPYFNCYAREHDHDYIFLSPELLTALFFLRVDNPGPTRAFVLDVVRGIAANVIDRDVPEDEQRNRGFCIQRGMEGTVDQMWASRVLEAFHDRYREPNQRKSLRPPLAQFFGRTPVTLVVTGLLVIGGGVAGAETGAATGAAIGAIVPALAGGAFGAALARFFPAEP